MNEFKGRVVVPGTCKAEALVSRNGFNTLASFQMALMFNKAGVPCGDQNNPEINGMPMQGKALCLPITIGSTTGGMILFTACKTGKAPACMLFSESIDSLAASGACAAVPLVTGYLACQPHACLLIPYKQDCFLRPLSHRSPTNHAVSGDSPVFLESSVGPTQALLGAP